MNVKALIQSHYPEREENLKIMVDDLIKNGLEPKDIILLIDYDKKIESPASVIYSSMPMPINWWHGVAPLLDCDYIALLCDDLTLKPNSIKSLVGYGVAFPDIDVFGYEGGKFAETEKPYTDTISHTVQEFEETDFLIRFYFGRPKAFSRALSLYSKKPTKPIHDDLLLSLANKCAIIPTTEDSGWIELSEHNIAYSKRPSHYDERNNLIYESIRRRSL